MLWFGVVVQCCELVSCASVVFMVVVWCCVLFHVLCYCCGLVLCFNVVFSCCVLV